METVGLASVHGVGSARRRRTRPTRDEIPLGHVRALDAKLARLGRSSGSIRYAMGRGLEALARTSGYLELGFSSIEAYALERCERSAGWTREACSLVRRLEQRPAIRGALTAGRIGWSAALLVAQVASGEDETEWVRLAARMTVRQLRKRVTISRNGTEGDADEGSESQKPKETTDEDACTLTLTANGEDQWLFEAARMMVRKVDGDCASDELVMEAFIAEAFSSLADHLPEEATERELNAMTNDAERAWLEQLAKWQDEAEERCDRNVPPQEESADGSSMEEVMMDTTSSPESIDGQLRRLAARLVERDLKIGTLAEELWAANGWRLLGFATEKQYCEERLGMCHSAVKARRTLARRLERLPLVTRALRDGRIGFEAAQLVAGVANPETDLAWATRAAERTVVHLRQEVMAAGQLCRIADKEVVVPPTDGELAELRALEVRIVTGAGSAGNLTAGVRADVPPAMAGLARDLTAGATALETMGEFWRKQRGQPASLRSVGREAVRLRVSRGVRAMYRGLERLYAKYRPVPLSFLSYAASAVLGAWAYPLPAVAYGDVYARDGYRCTSPVCSRRDLTPHHVVFRSRGGADTPANTTSLCTECHLRAVHICRSLCVAGTAAALTFTLGRVPHTVVYGRRRVRLD